MEDLAERSLEDLEKDTTCAICHDHYTEPRVLPCCHYYCKQCIRGLSLRTAMDKPFSCPECRKDTTLPQGGVDSLPTAFFITRMKGVHSKLKRAQSKGEAKCEMCSGAKAKTFCRQCAKFICAECELSHPHRIISKFATNHKKYKPGNERVKETDYSDTRELILQTCRLHEEPMNMYCFDCNSLICRDCIVKYHHGHSHQVIKIQQYTAETHLKPKTSAFITNYQVDLTKGNQYYVKYTPTVRGHHELTVTVNGQEVAGSPFPVFVSIHPTKLGKPVQVIRIVHPADVAINSEGEIIIAEVDGDVVTLDREGKRLRSDHNLKRPRGVAVDKEDNIYFVDERQSSIYKCDKRMNKVIENKINKKIRGHWCVAVIGDKVMVCEQPNKGTITVYDKELKYVNEITPLGRNPWEFSSISSDEHGNLYVSDSRNHRIHVISINGDLLRSVGCDGNGENKLKNPFGVCVSGQYVYVTNFHGHNISVFTTEGKYVTSFGHWGRSEGDFANPIGVRADKDGFVYHCDYTNNRIQCF